jgi:hypothetical protein
MKLLSAQDRMAAITADVLVLVGFCGFHAKVWRLPSLRRRGVLLSMIYFACNGRNDRTELCNS